jgi:hypothetical protein
MSLLVMVSLEPGEHLLLYIVAKAEVVSMVLVTEWPGPKQPQALKEAPVAGSGSQDLDPAEGPQDQEASKPQIPKTAQSPKPQSGSWLPKVPSGPGDQEASRSWMLEPISSPDSKHATGS